MLRARSRPWRLMTTRGSRAASRATRSGALRARTTTPSPSPSRRRWPTCRPRPSRSSGRSAATPSTPPGTCGGRRSLVGRCTA
eukprot:13716952-Alexandrium_andersonii.AAC.1